jgi:lipopolysaccharide heptosyltransferase II
MKILVINPFGIGDVIFSTPLIRALRESYPDCFVGYVCNKRAYEVLSSDPNLSKVFVYEKDEYRKAWEHSKLKCLKMIFVFLEEIKRERFDIAIDLSLGYQYSLICKFLGIKQRIGFNYRDRGKFLTKKIDIDGFSEKHVIEYYRDTLRLLGVDPERFSRSPKVHIKDQDIAWAGEFLKTSGVKDGDLLIGIIPGCGASWGADANHRRWDRDGFAKVCDGMAERYGAKVVLLGDRNEVGICEEIQGMLKHKAIMSCGRTNLRNFLGLINRCRLIVTNDGGPLHMAVGLGISTISIFGPVDEKIYGPYPPSPNHIVISKTEMKCRPCYRKFKHNVCKERPCLKNIGPEEVLKAVECLLSKSGKKAAAQ